MQGEQHFKEVKYWGGISTFEKIRERDKRKFELCTHNEIKLLYYAEQNYDSSYELITTKQKLLESIKNSSIFATGNITDVGEFTDSK